VATRSAGSMPSRKSMVLYMLLNIRQ
jgi:hypothetical protein